jgi:hypothetical protein
MDALFPGRVKSETDPTGAKMVSTWPHTLGQRGMIGSSKRRFIN